MKKKLVLKPFVVPMFYGVIAVAILISLFLSIEVVDEKEKYTYVSDVILDEYIPVINTEDKVLRPYTSSDVTVLNDYYDVEKEETQENSIIVYNSTYIQNTGINYTSSNPFDIVSILDGEVVEVKDKELLGKSVTIKHDKDIISVYQSLKDINVKQGDKVSKGQVIAKSGSCDLIKDKENNLHFELYINGKIENPNNYYDKKVGEI